MTLSKPHKLSDGNTMRVRMRRSIAGTYYEEVHSLKGRPRMTTLWRLDTSMFLIAGNDDRGYLPTKIDNPDYSYARDDKHGMEVALKFFVDSAEACIKQAREEDLPVISMYRLDWQDLTAVEGTPLDEIPHADYPHEPGRLYDCPRCEAECFCSGRAGDTECVFCASL